jgi:hypothetical protein
MGRIHLAWIWLALGCTPANPLESGSYVPLPGEDGAGLTGINLNLEENKVFFVLDDSVEERTLQDVPDEAWPLGCDEQRKKGIVEEATDVKGSLELPNRTHDRIVLSAWCERAGVVHLSAATGWNLLLGPL